MYQSKSWHVDQPERRPPPRTQAVDRVPAVARARQVRAAAATLRKHDDAVRVAEAPRCEREVRHGVLRRLQRPVVGRVGEHAREELGKAVVSHARRSDRARRQRAQRRLHIGKVERGEHGERAAHRVARQHERRARRPPLAAARRVLRRLSLEFRLHRREQPRPQREVRLDEAAVQRQLGRQPSAPRVRRRRAIVVAVRDVGEHILAGARAAERDKDRPSVADEQCVRLVRGAAHLGDDTQLSVRPAMLRRLARQVVAYSHELLALALNLRRVVGREREPRTPHCERTVEALGHIGDHRGHIWHCGRRRGHNWRCGLGLGTDAADQLRHCDDAAHKRDRKRRRRLRPMSEALPRKWSNMHPQVTNALGHDSSVPRLTTTRFDDSVADEHIVNRTTAPRRVSHRNVELPRHPERRYCCRG
mmetsp:Transcript_63141/g.173431  ORF Transcript_63141/g.173431 Transcript_63141/m.173431 type:complete len:419 (-) Transcript_63141:79-1335(-)